MNWQEWRSSIPLVFKEEEMPLIGRMGFSFDMLKSKFVIWQSDSVRLDSIFTWIDPLSSIPIIRLDLEKEILVSQLSQCYV